MATSDSTEIQILGKSSGKTSSGATKADVKRISDEGRETRNFLLVIMVGVVIFVVVTFWIELVAMHQNQELDKSLAVQNNELNKDYFDKVLILDTQLQELKTQIEVLKASNPYLK